MLRLLDKEGKIVLPPSQNSPRSSNKPVKLLEHNTEPIQLSLRGLMPLTVGIVADKAETETFKSLLCQYHYLGFDQTVGENMKYIVRCKNGNILACLLFGSAAWSCRDRDVYIGWNASQRKERLLMLTNNQRFLIPQWVSVPFLASHVLSVVSRRISGDWEIKYGHPLYALETFVDNRFKGTCYQAANWTRAGSTKGRGRNDRDKTYSLPVKDIYLYPLLKNAYRKLSAESL